MRRRFATPSERALSHFRCSRVVQERVVVQRTRRRGVSETGLRTQATPSVSRWSLKASRYHLFTSVFCRTEAEKGCDRPKASIVVSTTEGIACVLRILEVAAFALVRFRTAFF